MGIMSGDILVTTQGVVAMVPSESEPGMLQNKHPTMYRTDLPPKQRSILYKIVVPPLRMLIQE